MQLTVIGSSDAFNSGGSGNACYWLDSPGAAPFMVDFGCTALQALRQCGRSPSELDGILFTHLHGDHFGGFAVLHVTLTFPENRERPFVVAGPRGTRERLEAFLQLAYGSGVTEHAKFEIEWIELDPGDEIEFLGRTVKAYAADHLEAPEQALCLKVSDPDGASVAFSGDTMPCAGLRAAADGADLLVAECSAMRPPAGHHCTWEDWQGMLADMSAGRVLLTHLGDDVLKELPAILAVGQPAGPPVQMASDGLKLDVSKVPQA